MNSDEDREDVDVLLHDADHCIAVRVTMSVLIDLSQNTISICTLNYLIVAVPKRVARRSGPRPVQYYKQDKSS